MMSKLSAAAAAIMARPVHLEIWIRDLVWNLKSGRV